MPKEGLRRQQARRYSDSGVSSASTASDKSTLSVEYLKRKYQPYVRLENVSSENLKNLRQGPNRRMNLYHCLKQKTLRPDEAIPHSSDDEQEARGRDLTKLRVDRSPAIKEYSDALKRLNGEMTDNDVDEPIRQYHFSGRTSKDTESQCLRENSLDEFETSPKYVPKRRSRNVIESDSSSDELMPKNIIKTRSAINKSKFQPSEKRTLRNTPRKSYETNNSETEDEKIYRVTRSRNKGIYLNDSNESDENMDSAKISSNKQSNSESDDDSKVQKSQNTSIFNENESDSDENTEIVMSKTSIKALYFDDNSNSALNIEEHNSKTHRKSQNYTNVVNDQETVDNSGKTCENHFDSTFEIRDKETNCAKNNSKTRRKPRSKSKKLQSFTENASDQKIIGDSQNSSDIDEYCDQNSPETSHHATKMPQNYSNTNKNLSENIPKTVEANKSRKNSSEIQETVLETHKSRKTLFENTSQHYTKSVNASKMLQNYSEAHKSGKSSPEINENTSERHKSGNKSTEINKNSSKIHKSRKNSTEIDENTLKTHKSRKNSTEIDENCLTTHTNRKYSTEVDENSLKMSKGRKKSQENISENYPKIHRSRKDSSEISSKTHKSRKNSTEIDESTSKTHKTSNENIPKMSRNHLKIHESEKNVPEIIKYSSKTSEHRKKSTDLNENSPKMHEEVENTSKTHEGRRKSTKIHENTLNTHKSRNNSTEIDENTSKTYKSRNEKNHSKTHKSGKNSPEIIENTHKRRNENIPKMPQNYLATHESGKKRLEIHENVSQDYLNSYENTHENSPKTHETNSKLPKYSMEMHKNNQKTHDTIKNLSESFLKIGELSQKTSQSPTRSCSLLNVAYETRKSTHSESEIDENLKSDIYNISEDNFKKKSLLLLPSLTDVSLQNKNNLLKWEESTTKNVPDSLERFKKNRSGLLEKLKKGSFDTLKKVSVEKKPVTESPEKLKRQHLNNVVEKLHILSKSPENKKNVTLLRDDKFHFSQQILVNTTDVLAVPHVKTTHDLIRKSSKTDKTSLESRKKVNWETSKSCQMPNVRREQSKSFKTSKISKANSGPSTGETSDASRELSKFFETSNANAKTSKIGGSEDTSLQNLMVADYEETPLQNPKIRGHEKTSSQNLTIREVEETSLQSEHVNDLSCDENASMHEEEMYFSEDEVDDERAQSHSKRNSHLSVRKRRTENKEDGMNEDDEYDYEEVEGEEANDYKETEEMHNYNTTIEEEDTRNYRETEKEAINNNKETEEVTRNYKVANKEETRNYEKTEIHNNKVMEEEILDYKETEEEEEEEEETQNYKEILDYKETAEEETQICKETQNYKETGQEAINDKETEEEMRNYNITEEGRCNYKESKETEETQNDAEEENQNCNETGEENVFYNEDCIAKSTSHPSKTKQKGRKRKSVFTWHKRRRPKKPPVKRKQKEVVDSSNLKSLKGELLVETTCENDKDSSDVDTRVSSRMSTRSSLSSCSENIIGGGRKKKKSFDRKMSNEVYSAEEVAPREKTTTIRRMSTRSTASVGDEEATVKSDRSVRKSASSFDIDVNSDKAARKSTSSIDSDFNNDKAVRKSTSSVESDVKNKMSPLDSEMMKEEEELIKSKRKRGRPKKLYKEMTSDVDAVAAVNQEIGLLPLCDDTKVTEEAIDPSSVNETSPIDHEKEENVVEMTVDVETTFKKAKTSQVSKCKSTKKTRLQRTRKNKMTVAISKPTDDDKKTQVLEDIDMSEAFTLTSDEFKYDRNPETAWGASKYDDDLTRSQTSNLEMSQTFSQGMSQTSNLRKSQTSNLGMSQAAFNLEMSQAVYSDLRMSQAAAYNVEMSPEASSNLKMSRSAASNLKMSPAAASNLKMTQAAASNLEMSPAAASNLEMSPTTASNLEMSLTAASNLKMSQATASDLEMSQTAASNQETTQGAFNLETSHSASKTMNVFENVKTPPYNFAITRNVKVTVDDGDVKSTSEMATGRVKSAVNDEVTSSTLPESVVMKYDVVKSTGDDRETYDYESTGHHKSHNQEISNERSNKTMSPIELITDQNTATTEATYSSVIKNRGIPQLKCTFTNDIQTTDPITPGETVSSTRLVTSDSNQKITSTLIIDDDDVFDYVDFDSANPDPDSTEPDLATVKKTTPSKKLRPTEMLRRHFRDKLLRRKLLAKRMRLEKEKRVESIKSADKPDTSPRKITLDKRKDSPIVPFKITFKNDFCPRDGGVASTASTSMNEARKKNNKKKKKKIRNKSFDIDPLEEARLLASDSSGNEGDETSSGGEVEPPDAKTKMKRKRRSGETTKVRDLHRNDAEITRKLVEFRKRSDEKNLGDCELVEAEKQRIINQMAEQYEATREIMHKLDRNKGKVYISYDIPSIKEGVRKALKSNKTEEEKRLARIKRFGLTDDTLIKQRSLEIKLINEELNKKNEMLNNLPSRKEYFTKSNVPFEPSGEIVQSSNSHFDSFNAHYETSSDRSGPRNSDFTSSNVVFETSSNDHFNSINDHFNPSIDSFNQRNVPSNTNNNRFEPSKARCEISNDRFTPCSERLNPSIDRTNNLSNDRSNLSNDRTNLSNDRISLSNDRFKDNKARFEASDTRFEASNTRIEPSNTCFETINPRFEPNNEAFEQSNVRFDHLPNDYFESSNDRLEANVRPELCNDRFEANNDPEPRKPHFVPSNARIRLCDDQLDPSEISFDAATKNNKQVGTSNVHFESRTHFESIKAHFELSNVQSERSNVPSELSNVLLEPSKVPFQQSNVRFETGNVHFKPSNILIESNNVGFESGNVPSNVLFETSNILLQPSNLQLELRNVQLEPSNLPLKTSNIHFEQNNVRFEPSNTQIEQSYTPFKSSNINLDPSNVHFELSNVLFEPSNAHLDFKSSNVNFSKNNKKQNENLRRSNENLRCSKENLRRSNESLQRSSESESLRSNETTKSNRSRDDITKSNECLRQRSNDRRWSESSEIGRNETISPGNNNLRRSNNLLKPDYKRRLERSTENLRSNDEYLFGHFSNKTKNNENFTSSKSNDESFATNGKKLSESYECLTTRSEEFDDRNDELTFRRSDDFDQRRNVFNSSRKDDFNPSRNDDCNRKVCGDFNQRIRDIFDQKKSDNVDERKSDDLSSRRNDNFNLRRIVDLDPKRSDDFNSRRDDALNTGRNDDLNLVRNGDLSQGRNDDLSLGRNVDLSQGRNNDPSQGRNDYFNSRRCDDFTQGRSDSFDRRKSDSADQRRSDDFNQGRIDGHDRRRSESVDKRRSDGFDKRRCGDFDRNRGIDFNEGKSDDFGGKKCDDFNLNSRDGFNRNRSNNFHLNKSDDFIQRKSDDDFARNVTDEFTRRRRSDDSDHTGSNNFTFRNVELNQERCNESTNDKNRTSTIKLNLFDNSTEKQKSRVERFGQSVIDKCGELNQALIKNSVVEERALWKTENERKRTRSEEEKIEGIDKLSDVECSLKKKSKSIRSIDSDNESIIHRRRSGSTNDTIVGSNESIESRNYDIEGRNVEMGKNRSIESNNEALNFRIEVRNVPILSPQKTIVDRNDAINYGKETIKRLIRTKHVNEVAVTVNQTKTTDYFTTSKSQLQNQTEKRLNRANVIKTNERDISTTCQPNEPVKRVFSCENQTDKRLRRTVETNNTMECTYETNEHENVAMDIEERRSLSKDSDKRSVSGSDSETGRLPLFKITVRSTANDDDMQVQEMSIDDPEEESPMETSDEETSTKKPHKNYRLLPTSKRPKSPQKIVLPLNIDLSVPPPNYVPPLQRIRPVSMYKNNPWQHPPPLLNLNLNQPPTPVMQWLPAEPTEFLGPSTSKRPVSVQPRRLSTAWSKWSPGKDNSLPTKVYMEKGGEAEDQRMMPPPKKVSAIKVREERVGVASPPRRTERKIGHCLSPTKTEKDDDGISIYVSDELRGDIEEPFNDINSLISMDTAAPPRILKPPKPLFNDFRGSGHPQVLDSVGKWVNSSSMLALQILVRVCRLFKQCARYQCRYVHMLKPEFRLRLNEAEPEEVKEIFKYLKQCKSSLVDTVMPMVIRYMSDRGHCAPLVEMVGGVLRNLTCNKGDMVELVLSGLTGGKIGLEFGKAVDEVMAFNGLHNTQLNDILLSIITRKPGYLNEHWHLITTILKYHKYITMSSIEDIMKTCIRLPKNKPDNPKQFAKVCQGLLFLDSIDVGHINMNVMKLFLNKLKQNKLYDLHYQLKEVYIRKGKFTNFQDYTDDDDSDDEPTFSNCVTDDPDSEVESCTCNAPSRDSLCFHDLKILRFALVENNAVTLSELVSKCVAMNIMIPFLNQYVSDIQEFDLNLLCQIFVGLYSATDFTSNVGLKHAIFELGFNTLPVFDKAQEYKLACKIIMLFYDELDLFLNTKSFYNPPFANNLRNPTEKLVFLFKILSRGGNAREASECITRNTFNLDDGNVALYKYKKNVISQFLSGTLKTDLAVCRDTLHFLLRGKFQMSSEPELNNAYNKYLQLLVDNSVKDVTNLIKEYKTFMVNNFRIIDQFLLRASLVMLYEKLPIMELVPIYEFCCSVCNCYCQQDMSNGIQFKLDVSIEEIRIIYHMYLVGMVNKKIPAKFIPIKIVDGEGGSQSSSRSGSSSEGKRVVFGNYKKPDVCNRQSLMYRLPCAFIGFKPSVNLTDVIGSRKLVIPQDAVKVCLEEVKRGMSP